MRKKYKKEILKELHKIIMILGHIALKGLEGEEVQKMLKILDDIVKPETKLKIK